MLQRMQIYLQQENEEKILRVPIIPPCSFMENTTVEKREGHPFTNHFASSANPDEMEKSLRVHEKQQGIVLLS